MQIDHFPDLVQTDLLLEKIRSGHCAWGTRPVDKPLYLFGAGNLGQMASEYFRVLGIAPQGAVDFALDRGASPRLWNGVPLSNPHDVESSVKKESLVAVCISTHPYEQLATKLREAGWQDVVPFYDIAESYRDRHPLSNGWFAAPLSDSDLCQIRSVIRRWGDELSRAHYLQFLAWRCLREEWGFAQAPVNTANRYFIPEVLDWLDQNTAGFECLEFLDVGAHYGEVSEQLLRETSGKFRRIDLIEPDVDNLSLLESRLASLARRSAIHVHPVVVGAEGGEVPFRSGLGYASQIVDRHGQMRTVSTIDSRALKPSFIKLHLEGWELPALRGAVDTLARCRPVIAATVYHNDLGLFRTANWLAANLEDYRFLFRLHGWCGCAAVVYCLPEAV